jgi:hypothetical protein
MQADALTTAVFLHASLVLENAAVFVQNGFVGSANSVEPNNSVLINLTAEDFVIGDPYHVMLHYSSHISPGWARVAADSDTEQVLASAWVSPDDGAMAIVLTNPGLIDQVVTLDTGASVRAASTVIRTVLRGVERSADLGALPADNMLTLPGQSLVTVTLQR